MTTTIIDSSTLQPMSRYNSNKSSASSYAEDKANRRCKERERRQNMSHAMEALAAALAEASSGSNRSLRESNVELLLRGAATIRRLREDNERIRRRIIEESAASNGRKPATWLDHQVE